MQTPDFQKHVTENSITLKYLILKSWNKSVLYIRDTDPDRGNCTVNVTVSATEAAMNDAQVSADDSLFINPISFEPIGDEYKNDRRRCNPFYASLDHNLHALAKMLTDLKNNPGPPPEMILGQVLDAVARVENDAQHAARTSGISRNQLLKELQFPNALLSEGPRASDEILSLIRPNLQETTSELDSDKNGILSEGSEGKNSES